MIDSSISCSSSWDSNQDFTEVPYAEFDECLHNFERSFSTFNELSNGSTVYDDFIFNDFEKILPVNDSFISQVLEESSSIGFESGWSLLGDIHSYSLPFESSSTSSRESPKKFEKSLNYLSNKSWSKMSSEEQNKTLHSLSEIVTCHMGIKDQMEVIKIIDPSVTISPDDKEFALDISCLNDAKMKRIQDFVKRKKLSNSPKKNFVSKKMPQLNNVLSKKPNSKSKKRQKQTKFIDDDDDDDDDIIRQKRKLELHGQKEMRSGLFVYEKVIKKLSDPLEEDEDVNILE